MSQVIEFPKSDDLQAQIMEYFRRSEAWSRRQYETFWQEEKALDTPLWRAIGGAAW